MNSPGQHEIIVRCADPPVRRSAGAPIRRRADPPAR
jgi:hypothetical protein